jgi:DNA-directed RNA polymerase alpha subunit
MILDILTVLFFVSGFLLILIMIAKRRRDVLHGRYVTKEQDTDFEREVEDEGQMTDRDLLDPTPELPDDTLIGDVEFPTRIRTVLASAGLKTVGEVREMSDEALLSLPDFGKTSIVYLREVLGLPSAAGVRPGKKPI